MGCNTLKSATTFRPTCWKSSGFRFEFGPGSASLSRYHMRLCPARTHRYRSVTKASAKTSNGVVVCLHHSCAVRIPRPFRSQIGGPRRSARDHRHPKNVPLRRQNRHPKLDLGLGYSPTLSQVAPTPGQLRGRHPGDISASRRGCSPFRLQLIVAYRNGSPVQITESRRLPAQRPERRRSRETDSRHRQ